MPPLRMRLLHFRRCRDITVAVLWSQRGSRGLDMGIKACLFAFVWWTSKTSIAIMASHRIGLLHKNTAASILQGWSGTEGVGAARGGRRGCTKYSFRNVTFASCFLSSLHSLISLCAFPIYSNKSHEKRMHSFWHVLYVLSTITVLGLVLYSNYY